MTRGRALRRAAFGVAAAIAVAAPALRSAQPSAWVARSNEHARLVLEAQAKLTPEGAAQLGVSGVDEQITDLTAGFTGRVRATVTNVQQELQRRLTAEKDPLVAQDLEILIQATRQQLHSLDVAERLLLPYSNPPAAVFNGLRALLDDQVPQERRRAAIVRLRKYTGTEPGFKPFTELALERLREQLPRKELLGPFRAQVERDLGNISFFVSGLDELFKKYDLPDAGPLLATLKTQFTAYEQAVRAELLPRSRTDFKLPPDLYASNLDQYGVDHPAGRARHSRPQGVQRHPGGDAGHRRRDRTRTGESESRLPRRDPRSQEAPARRRRDPAALPAAPEAARGDHRGARSW